MKFYDVCCTMVLGGAGGVDPVLTAVAGVSIVWLPTVSLCRLSILKFL